MDLKNLEDLKKITQYCRKNGIKSLKVGEIEIQFDSSALFPESSYMKKKAEDSADPTSDKTYSEEDMLFWSSQGVGEAN